MPCPFDARMLQVMDHSEAVAHENYDQSQTTVVAKVKKFLADVNGTPDILPTDVTAKNAKLRAKREARAAAQARMSEAAAAEYIKESSSDREAVVVCRERTGRSSSFGIRRSRDGEACCEHL